MRHSGSPGSARVPVRPPYCVHSPHQRCSTGPYRRSRRPRAWTYCRARSARARAAADPIDEYRLVVQPLELGRGSTGRSGREERKPMGKVQAQAIMSVDGYVAKQDNTIGRLFDWLQNGEVAIPTPAGDFSVHLNPASVEHWTGWASSPGALVCGRVLFDVTDGWQGRHTLDLPVVVVTHQIPKEWVEEHPDAPFTFVTDGPEAAIAEAQQIAGDRVVTVTGGDIARQGPRVGAARRSGDRPRAGGHGRGEPALLRQAVHRGRLARQPDHQHPRRPGHPPRLPRPRLTDSPTHYGHAAGHRAGLTTETLESDVVVELEHAQAVLAGLDQLGKTRSDLRKR